jgi:DtxR family Mn-dependent transcriptional regulator
MLGMPKSTLSDSLEDYLEAIHHIVQAKGAARGKDIAQRLGVNRSSVSGALRSLAGKNLINYAPYDIVTLTPQGERVAQRVVQRHEVLREFFVRVLGVEVGVAEENACGMEHALSQTVLERLIHLVEFIRLCPRIDIRWTETTGYFCRRPETLEECERCIEECMRQVRKRKRMEAHGQLPC